MYVHMYDKENICNCTRYCLGSNSCGWNGQWPLQTVSARWKREPRVKKGGEFGNTFFFWERSELYRIHYPSVCPLSR